MALWTRLRGVGGFLLAAVAVFALLRVLHVAAPLVAPQILAGPFYPATLGEVRALAGFVPAVPFYHPEALGSAVPAIVVTRQPRAVVELRWNGARFLVLRERASSSADPPLRGDAQPLPGRPDVHWWTEGRETCAQLTAGGLTTELRTDLPRRDLERLVATLEAYSPVP
jgi:hypothetical protein